MPPTWERNDMGSRIVRRETGTGKGSGSGSGSGGIILDFTGAS